MRKVRVPATQPLSAPRSCPKSDSSWAGIVVEPWIVGVGWEPLVVNLSAVDDVNGRINDVITGCFLLSHSFLIRSVLFAAAISSKQQVQTYWARSLSENSRQWWIFHGLPQRIPVQCLMQSAVADTLVVGFIWNDFFAPSLNLLRRSGASDYLRTLEFWAEVVPILFLPMLALVRWRKRSIHIAFRCSISCTDCKKQGPNPSQRSRGSKYFGKWLDRPHLVTISESLWFPLAVCFLSFWAEICSVSNALSSEMLVKFCQMGPLGMAKRLRLASTQPKGSKYHIGLRNGGGLIWDMAWYGLIWDGQMLIFHDISILSKIQAQSQSVQISAIESVKHSKDVYIYIYI